jgi:hypothetical protein
MIPTKTMSFSGPTGVSSFNVSVSVLIFSSALRRPGLFLGSRSFHGTGTLQNKRRQWHAIPS